MNNRNLFHETLKSFIQKTELTGNIVTSARMQVDKLNFCEKKGKSMESITLNFIYLLFIYIYIIITKLLGTRSVFYSMMLASVCFYNPVPQP